MVLLLIELTRALFIQDEKFFFIEVKGSLVEQLLVLFKIQNNLIREG
jgi:hypothetical protein